MKTRRRYRKAAILFSTAAIAASISLPATADVTISTDPTSNMTCSAGVCAPTAVDAVLNVDDLESLLASANIEVTTTGSGVQAKNINVTAATTWSSASALTLDAWRSISIAATVSVAGQGDVSLASNHGGNGGAIVYKNGNLAFADLASSLSINRRTFTLVADIKTLAADIASNSSGNFALASNFDASGDGTYSTDPVETLFEGIFDGLGNAISNLSISDDTEDYVGLFNSIGTLGTVRNINVANASIAISHSNGGALAGENNGTILRCSSSGNVNGGSTGVAGGLVGLTFGAIKRSFSSASATGYIAGGLAGSSAATIRASSASGAVTSAEYAGGLIGNNFGAVFYSHATGDVSDASAAGGLVGFDAGWITQSYATGSVTNSTNGAGGLVGAENGALTNSYATGDVAGGSPAGGLVGCLGEQCGQGLGGAVSTSYSTGAVDKHKGGQFGGFVGFDSTFGGITSSYWDTTTSGRRKGTGNRGNEPGLIGLTTEKLQSKLPHGFSKKIWAEYPGINGGFPYLIANPPPN